MLSPGQGHIGEAEILAALLGDVLGALVAKAGSSPPDVDGSFVAGVRVVEDRERIVGDVAWLPQVGVVDDGILESLAAMDGEDLHRFGVGFEAAAAVLVIGVGVGFNDALAEPAGEGGRAPLL